MITVEVTTGPHITYTVRMPNRVYRVIATRRSQDEREDPIVQGEYAVRWLRGVR
jgi:hypothetical protein